MNEKDMAMALYGLSHWAEEPGIQKAMLSLIKRICRDASVRNKMNAHNGYVFARRNQIAE